MIAIEITLEDKEFHKAVADTLKQCSDLRIPFGLMAQSWFKSNHAIFALTGPGKYADLKPSTKKYKLRKYGFVYPILRARGILEKSLTNPSDSNKVVQIEKTTLTLGSNVKYAKHLHFGTKHMPARPMVLLGAEQVAPAEVNKRREAWIKLLADFVTQKAPGN